MTITEPISIRPFVATDYERALRFWSTIEGLGLNESDTPEAITAFLDRNPGFSAIALSSGGEVVGTILCGHNGRAGSINHLAVMKAYRSHGLGKRLVEFAFERLASANIPRCNIFVYNDNHEGNQFWLRSGWSDPNTWRVLQKHVKA
jgi:putative acetyltransferase